MCFGFSNKSTRDLDKDFSEVVVVEARLQCGKQLIEGLARKVRSSTL